MRTDDILKIFRLLFPKMALFSVYYILGAIAVILIVNILSAQSGISLANVFADSSSPIIFGTVSLFVAIMGSIVYGVYFERLLSLGVTRKNITLGALLASFALSVCLGVLFIIAGFAFGFYSAPDAAANFVTLLLVCINFLLAGFAVAVGFMLRRWYTATLGIIYCIILVNLTSAMPKDGTGLFHILPFPDPVPWIVLLAAAALTFAVVLAAVKRVPVKC